MAIQRNPRYKNTAIAGKMTKAQIQARFDAETASVYAQKDPIWMPDYAASMELITDMLKITVPLDAKIMDLGAGTGNLSLRVLQALPGAQVTLVDFSENMLSEVPNILKRFNNYNIIRDDFFTMPFKRGACHAVVSSFAIHHGRGPSVYGKLYRKIHSTLKNKGVFLCSDVVHGDAPEVADMMEAGWHDHLLQHYSRKVADNTLAHYAREDSPLSLAQHMRLLRKAGFRAADVLWKKYNFAVYCGIK